MNFDSVIWKKRIDFLTLVTWLLTSLGLAVISFLWFGIDFRGYYAAARVLTMGGNPYDYHQVAPVLLEITGFMGGNPYYYPPWFAWFFIPVAGLPYQLARAIWMGFNVIIWNISLWKLSKGLAWPAKGWRRYVLFTLLTFTLAWITWRFEQAAVLLFYILVEAVLSGYRQKWNWTGFWLAMLLIKPNLTLGAVIAICLWLIRKRQWRPVLVMTSILVALLAVSTWITPAWFQPFFEPGFGRGLTLALDGPDRVLDIRKNTTIFDWLAIFKIEENYRSLIYYGLLAPMGIVSLALVIWRSKAFLQVMSISLLITYALTPYAMQYDYAPLAFVLVWTLSICNSSRNTRLVAWLLAGFFFSVSIWQRDIAWGYWMVIGLILLTLWSLYQSKGNLDTLPNGEQQAAS